MKVIGIDPGTTTGVAIWDVDKQQLLAVESYAIHIAMSVVKLERSMEGAAPFVIFEDARQRTWFGGSGKEKWQGAGSIKRDCWIWEDYLTYIDVPFIARPPKSGATKYNADQFSRITKWQGRTNEHSRDAAMIVYGLNRPMVMGMLRSVEERKANKQSKRSRRVSPEVCP